MLIKNFDIESLKTKHFFNLKIKFHFYLTKISPKLYYEDEKLKKMRSLFVSFTIIVLIGSQIPVESLSLSSLVRNEVNNVSKFLRDITNVIECDTCNALCKKIIVNFNFIMKPLFDY